MAEQYPDRPSYWAQRVIRAMTKTAAAQDIGAAGFSLVSMIAAQEDAKRYSGPVTWYNGQLAPLLGIKKWETLDAVRAKAVASGWLHYEAPPAGSRTIPGSYWSLIPGSGIDDGPSDEGPAPDWYAIGFADGYKACQRGEPMKKNGSDYIQKTDTVADTVDPTISDSRIRSRIEGGYGHGLKADTVADRSRITSLPEPLSLSLSHTHDRSDSLIPQGSNLDTPAFHATWQQWLEHYRGKQGSYPTPQNQLHALADLDRRGLELALKDIAFSIRKDAKTILDSTNDFQKRGSKPDRPPDPSLDRRLTPA